MKNSITRDFYIPTEATLTHSDPSGTAVYCYESSGKPCAIGFSGKSQKPTFRYSFQSAARRQEYIAKFIADRQAADARRVERREARKYATHGVKVGDIFCDSWGYDQTNIDYYEVVKLIGTTMAEVLEIGKRTQETGFMSGECVPAPGNYLTDPVFEDGRPVYDDHGNRVHQPRTPRRVKIQIGDYWVGNSRLPYIAIRGYSYAYLIQPTEVAPGVKVFQPDHWTAYA